MTDHVFPSSSELSRRRALAAAALAGLGATALATRGAVVQEASPSPDDEAAFLFVQSGFTSGILDQATEGVQSWMMTLHGAPPQTVFFPTGPRALPGRFRSGNSSRRSISPRTILPTPRW